ncbi:PulJ/GspJ family protein [Lacinutrix chionoecetis]
MSKRIKAFTILEVVISLAIMSIIIAMVYVIFTLLSKQLYQYSNQTEQINNYNQLNSLLIRDLHNASNISYTANELLLTIQSDSIKYAHANNKLIRTHVNSIDTFSIEIKTFNIVENNLLFINKRRPLQVTYHMFDQDIVGYYYKDFGVSNRVNKQFFSNGN